MLAAGPAIALSARSALAVVNTAWRAKDYPIDLWPLAISPAYEPAELDTLLDTEEDTLPDLEVGDAGLDIRDSDVGVKAGQGNCSVDTDHQYDWIDWGSK